MVPEWEPVFAPKMTCSHGREVRIMRMRMTTSSVSGWRDNFIETSSLSPSVFPLPTETNSTLMSAAHRKLTRLPLPIFEGLLYTESGTQPSTPHELRSTICEKLKRFRVRSRHGGTKSVSLKTVGDLLRTPRRTLLEVLDPLLTFGEIELLLKRVCNQCTARPVSCLILLNRTTNDISTVVLPLVSQTGQTTTVVGTNVGDRMRYLPTGLESLDRRGSGGIRVGTITEIVGRAGAGKTQFALQLALTATKYNQGTMYIDTEKKLDLRRLKEMAAERFAQMEGGGRNSMDGSNSNNRFGLESAPPSNKNNYFQFKDPDVVLSNVIVKGAHSTEELLNVLEQAEEEILHCNQHGSKFPVRLLIVDSIAAPLKRDFGSDAAPQRAATAFSIAQTLKRYADQLHLAVVVINQVGLDNNQATTGRRFDQVAVRAALGTSWHHCVSTRFLLEHEVDPHRDGWRPGAGKTHEWRHLTVVKSNLMPMSKSHFEISLSGIVEVSDNFDEDAQ